jgi:type II secretory pathway predicted ATPase ExeA
MNMYSKHFGLVELPFSVTPDPRFSYTNSLYREAFATLRYGIEARKGFIVITGEAGTGKTTLLRRLMRSVEATVHTAFIFNTHLDFTELLRLVLNDLGVANSSQDRLTLMAQLNDYLIEQLHKDHIVSVLVDEAQDLSDAMLEELRLLSNLETDRAKLIQIVLMGQPELERKLDQPELRQLKQRVAVRCRLAPLRSDEVAPYINSRLQTVGYEGQELFDLGSVQKIALYSKGIPRLINVICDNALLIAYAASQSKVSAKIVDEAARDLKLIEPSQVKVPEERKQASRQAKAQYDDKTWQSDFEKFPAGLEPPPSRLRQKRSREGVGIGLMLAVVILAGTVFYSQQSGSLAALAANLEDLVGIRWKNPLQAQAKPVPELLNERVPAEERITAEAPYVQMPAHQVPELSSSSLKRNDPNGAEIKPVENPPTPAPEANSLEAESSKTSADQIGAAAKSRNEIRPFLYSDAAVTAEKLEFEIYKAIHNRAIRSVEVSIKDGIVYLTGRVATERQKLAAARAARSVPGVKEVRDQVIVNSPITYRDGAG